MCACASVCVCAYVLACVCVCVYICGNGFIAFSSLPCKAKVIECSDEHTRKEGGDMMWEEKHSLEDANILYIAM